MIKKLVIFGVGLIGGSLAMSLKKTNYCNTIIGCSRSVESLQKAQELGVIDDYTLDPIEAVNGADMILLAVPMGAMGSVLQSIKGHVAAGAVVTDAGSAKASVQATGADVESMEVEKHDQVLAATSHLPHVLAYSLVDTLSHSDASDAIFHYAAGGFRDFTRIASSDPVMWRDICLENRDAILASMEEFQANLQILHQQVSDADSDGIMETFTHAKAVRDDYMKKQST